MTLPCRFVWGDGAHRCELHWDHPGPCECRCGTSRDHRQTNRFAVHRSERRRLAQAGDALEVEA